MSDPTAAKRLRAEAKATCDKLGDAARKMLSWAGLRGEGHELVFVPAADLEALADALAHQGGRLDMAVSMAHTRRKR